MPRELELVALQPGLPRPFERGTNTSPSITRLTATDGSRRYGQALAYTAPRYLADQSI